MWFAGVFILLTLGGSAVLSPVNAAASQELSKWVQTTSLLALPPSSISPADNLVRRQSRPPAPHHPDGYWPTRTWCPRITDFYGTWCRPKDVGIDGYTMVCNYNVGSPRSYATYNGHCPVGYVCKPHTKDAPPFRQWIPMLGTDPPQVRCAPDRWYALRRFFKRFKRDPPPPSVDVGRRRHSGGRSSVRRQDSGEFAECVGNTCAFILQCLAGACDGDGGGDCGETDLVEDGQVGPGTLSALLLGPDSKLLSTGVSKFEAIANGQTVCHADVHSKDSYSEHVCMPNTDFRCDAATKVSMAVSFVSLPPVSSHISWDWLESPAIGKGM